MLMHLHFRRIIEQRYIRIEGCIGDCRNYKSSGKWVHSFFLKRDFQINREFTKE